MERFLVISIHDVRAATLGRVRALCATLDALGARPRVLKVIPEGAGDDPALVAFLRAECAAGSELVLHGYTHRVDGALRGPPLARLRARLFAPGDAEFLALAPDEARARVARGRDELAALGLRTRLFSAPAWLHDAALPATLRELGFTGLVGMATLTDLRSGRRVATPWDGVVGAGATQERLARIPALAVALAEPGLPVLKVFLHPTPLAHPATRALLERLARYLRRRRLVTYSALL